jgi:hypothetical protein
MTIRVVLLVLLIVLVISHFAGHLPWVFSGPVGVLLVVLLLVVLLR